MYRSRFWTMRQYAGFATAEESNQRYRYLLEQGQTGLSVAFDLPTQIGYDADDPIAEGEVGKVGVSISSIEDMAQLFDQIPLDKVSTSMTINAPAAVLLAMYIAVAKRQGADVSKLRGTIQNDILKEYTARGTYIFPPQPSMRLITDIFSYCAREVPNWNTISISGYHIREAGSTAVQEVAFTLSNGIAYVEAALNAGLERGRFRPATVVLLQRAQQPARGSRQVPRRTPSVGKGHARALQSSRPQILGVALPHPDGRLHPDRPAAGEQRGARHLAGAVRRPGRDAKSLHTNSMDEALWLPTEKSVRVALRTQQIIAHESGVADSVDPLAGSYLVEYLTDEIENGADEYIAKIDEMGGALSAIERGYIQNEIQDAAYIAQKQIESGEQIVVGVNQFQIDEKIELERQKIDPAIEEAARKRLADLRANRDNAKVDELKERLVSAAQWRRKPDAALHRVRGKFHDPGRDLQYAARGLGRVCGGRVLGEQR